MRFGPRHHGERHGFGRTALHGASRAALGVVLGAALLGVTALPAVALPTTTQAIGALGPGVTAAGVDPLAVPAPDGVTEWAPTHGQTCDAVTFSHQRFWLLPAAELAKDPADRDWSTAVEPASATATIALGGTRTVQLPYTFGETITVPVPDPTATTPYTITLTVSYPDGAPVAGEHELGSVEGTFEPCADTADGAGATGEAAVDDAGQGDAAADGAADDGEVITEVLGERVVAGDDAAEAVDGGGSGPSPLVFVVLGLAVAGLGATIVLRRRPTEG